MKVKWRHHEFMAATFLAIILVSYYLVQVFSLTNHQAVLFQEYIHRYNLKTNYIKAVVLPQVGSVLLLYSCYIWISRGIVFQLKRGVFNDESVFRLTNFVTAVLQFAFICFLLGPIINIASFYCGSYYLNNVTHFPLSFGYHPQPPFNLFGGLAFSTGVVVLSCIVISIRELITYYVSRSAYWTMATNTATFIALLYFTILTLFTVFDLFSSAAFHFYTAVIPVCLLVLLTNTYALFPFKPNWIGPLLLSSFIYTVVFSRFLWEDWSFTYVLGVWALQLAIITPLSWLQYQRQKEKILHIKEIETALGRSEADLAFLRSQINPHFLFNVLNTLYGTALIDGSKTTASGIQKLGDMMRFMLEENHQEFIAISKEVAYLNDYIALQKLRTQLSTNIRITSEIQVAKNDRKIVPMLMIPFIENAFKYGIDLENASYINIALKDTARGVALEVCNSIHAKVLNDPEKYRSGIGIDNVAKRLDLLYPSKHKLTITEDIKEFKVKLDIQLI